MPNCFQLLEKDTLTPVSLNRVDEEICNLLNIKIDPKRYGGGVFNWFDSIGFLIAMGNGLHSKVLNEKMQEWELGPTYFKILDYLRENYNSTSF